MKQSIIALVALSILLLAFGCKKNPRAIIELPSDPEFVGEYLEMQDVRRIGHALNNAPVRQTIQWENPNTHYQFSMMVFTANKDKAGATRDFTVLTIAPDSTAEVLNLIGTSTKKNIWLIVAETPASVVGQAVRMELTGSPVPDVSISSGSDFHGFMVQD